LPLEYTALAAWIALAPPRSPLAGDNQHHPRPVGLSALQKAKERRMSLFLRVSVQIDPSIDGIAPAGHTLFEAAA
jgi:hypothetical protein